MGKQLITRWFLGSNSASGFHSLYGGFCSGENDFLRVIKGGPGTGNPASCGALGMRPSNAGWTWSTFSAPATRIPWTGYTSPLSAWATPTALHRMCSTPLSSASAAAISMWAPAAGG